MRTYFESIGVVVWKSGVSGLLGNLSNFTEPVLDQSSLAVEPFRGLLEACSTNRVCLVAESELSASVSTQDCPGLDG